MEKKKKKKKKKKEKRKRKEVKVSSISQRKEVPVYPTLLFQVSIISFLI
jgi:hypothetical protein